MRFVGRVSRPVGIFLFVNWVGDLLCVSLDGVDVSIDFFWTGLETRPTRLILVFWTGLETRPMDYCDSNVQPSFSQSELIHNRHELAGRRAFSGLRPMY